LRPTEQLSTTHKRKATRAPEPPHKLLALPLRCRRRRVDRSSRPWPLLPRRRSRLPDFRSPSRFRSTAPSRGERLLGLSPPGRLRACPTTNLAGGATAAALVFVGTAPGPARAIIGAATGASACPGTNPDARPTAAAAAIDLAMMVCCANAITLLLMSMSGTPALELRRDRLALRCRERFLRSLSPL
jgi:hypothetical protein